MMKGQNDGVKNEEEIVNYINDKSFSRLSVYWKKFIREFDPEVKSDCELKSKKIGGQGLKPDIIVNTENIECAISVKKGGGNSVHQEKTCQFVDYCKLYLGMNSEEEESLLMFLYGDGTIDGSAPKECRLGLGEVKEIYAKEIAIVQRFFDSHREELLYRFLVYGKDGPRTKRKADYIFHGTVDGGVSCPLDSYMISELAKITKGDSALSVGPLGFQVWNRNPSDTQEYRRHSIQVKWTSCEKDLQNLRERCIAYKNQIEKKIIGDNSHGFDNQAYIINFFNNSKVSLFSDVARRLINDINPTAKENDIVKACQINEKARVKIKVGNIEKKMSVFIGSGNSVHQEKINSFLDFCESLGMTKREKEAFLRVHYADGTVDGKGDISDRLDGKAAISEAFYEDVKIAQNFLNLYKKEMIQRFLIYGKDGLENNHRVDFIYYGSYKDGAYVSADNMVDYLLEVDNSSRAVLSVGPLSIQTWNRNLSGKKTTEYKRESIQVKWGKLRDHIYNAYELSLIKKNIHQNGTAEGTNEEYNLIRELNMNHDIQNDKWKFICDRVGLDSIDDIYAIRVTSHVKSNLSGRAVFPKADIYLARIKVKEDFLVEKNYIIDEEMFDNELKNKSIQKIDNSGISCKIKESRSFTYEKLTIDSFIKLFNNPMIGCGMSLFVKSSSELKLNKDILNAWGISYDRFKEFWNELIECDNENILLSQDICKKIKKKSEELIREKIDNDSYIKGVIFRGDDIFENPYNAPMIYSHGELTENKIDKYSITTGSGRHRGVYTIVIKP